MSAAATPPAAGTDPDQLHVYECRGPRLPRTEPKHPGLLGLWMEPPYYYLFFREPAADAVTGWLLDEPGHRLERCYTLPYSAWRENIGTTERIGPFVIGASAECPDAIPAGTLTIVLSRGLAFGSGLHPSTRGCLLALAEIHRRRPLTTAVDLGTGSGILALAARRLGAYRVTALDCNLLAVREALANARVNGLEAGWLALVASGLDALRPSPGEVLLMNLEWPCLLAALADHHWQAWPRVVWSGFLENQWPTLQRRLAPGWAVVWRCVLEDWQTVVLAAPERTAPGAGTGAWARS